MAFFTVMRFFSRVRSLARSNSRRATRRAGERRVILTYHRLAAPQFDPFALAIPPTWFHDHLDVLKSRSRPVTLDEILHTSAPDAGVLASITFDDGYVDNLKVASPMLRLAGIPATFFICTGSLGDSRGFWWDRLASAMAAAQTPAAALDPMKVISPVGDLTSPEARSKAAVEIADHLIPMHPVARDQLVAELETRLLSTGGGQPEAYPVLDEAGLRDLGSQPLTQLGAHTHRHPMLSRLTREEQLAEITRSVATIHDITGTRPRFVAYPYGGERTYNSDSCLAAKDAEMSAAFVNHAARFDPASRPYVVPRYYVPPLPAEAFRTWLDGILAA
jgi:peptidoglycan/xylan/chitin deacetylase (PgdA/CDA1 family)